MENNPPLQVSGQIILPGYELYNEKRKVWNKYVDRRPAAIFECESEADVISAVNYANNANLEISIRGGGHHLAGTAVCDNGVMIDMSQFRKVTVDEKNRRVYVEGGATLADVDLETQKFGLATPTGTVSQTGIAGLALGGGFGYLRGKYGLTCDNIVGARLVTAEGELITVNEQENPDLLWAIRGGGGNFGVVTSFEFLLHSVGPDVLAIDVMYDYKDSRKILKELQDYMESAPDDISVNLSIVRLPAAPFLPEFLHNRRVITLTGMYAGEMNGEEDGIIAPLLSLAEPIMDHTGLMPYTELQKKLDPMVPDDARLDGTSLFFKHLSDETIDILLQDIEQAELPMVMVQLWPLHGQMNRIPSQDTAFAIRDAGYLLIIDGEISPDDPAKCSEWMDSIYSKLLPFSSHESSYVNGVKVDKEITRKAYRHNYEKLVSIKKRYDPQNRFCHNHNIDPE
ncbi:FAD/FMN-containing dehydrogenase [Gracilibacillus ureilyticus]|uniref:FAD/FMN-containing dehydrogenase n=1 Tax=Gracilibacillus ureilyticus TaxID=531814 RepID=A0A1H9MN26_9BACI|nr:FAD-binding oxidoreductase [Gracilibacillus ureilyticus]SER24845.1 FAD/FMN-containing dehydrogenase [Gracilibacillus ureilyticus]